MGIYSPGGNGLLLTELDKLKIKPGCRVLEIGCGAGESAEFISDTYGTEVTGLDASEALITKARETYKNVIFVLGPAEEMAFPDGSFDLVICECTLSLSETPGSILGKVFKVLDCGGKILLIDLFERVDNRNDTRKVKSIAEKNGFEVLSEVDYTEELKTWAAQTVMEFGSVEAYFEEAVPAGEQVSAYCPAVSEMGATGYAAIVFGKN
jgi:ubiquinone/menaquinone biosynthesis C-methylase UbiE